MKDSATYEHIQPELIGNRQRVLLSDLSGRSNVKYKLDHYGIAEGLDEDARRRLLENIKEMEHQGYDFEVAEGNFELLVLQERYPDKKFFSLVGFDVATKAYGQGKSEAVASIIVNDQGHLRAATGTGQGPVRCASQCSAQVPGRTLSGLRQSPAARLQSPSAQRQQRHGGKSACAGGVGRR